MLRQVYVSTLLITSSVLIQIQTNSIHGSIQCLEVTYSLQKKQQLGVLTLLKIRGMELRGRVKIGSSLALEVTGGGK